MGQMDEDVKGGQQAEEGMMIEGRRRGGRRDPADHQCRNNSRMEGTSSTLGSAVAVATCNLATENVGGNSSSTSSSSGCSSTVDSTNSSQVTSPIKEDSGVGNSSSNSGGVMDISSSGTGSCSRSISQEDNCLRMTMSSSNSSSVGVSENVPQVATSTFSTYYRANDLNGDDCDDDDDEEDEEEEEDDDCDEDENDDRSEERRLSEQGSLSGKEEEEEDTSEGKNIIKSSSPSSVAIMKEKKKDNNNHKKKKKKDRERKKGFSIGLSLSGLSKVFHNNSAGRGGVGKSSSSNNHHQHHPHHQRSSSQSGSSTEHLVLMNNQICPGSTAAIMSTHSNVSKSSSESNIPMCHNSLDNLIDDLPSSRSTDSSCLLTNPEDNIDLQIRARRSIIALSPDGVNGNFGQFGQENPQDLLTAQSSASSADQQDSVAGHDIEGNSGENNHGNQERKTEPMSSTTLSSSSTSSSASSSLSSSVSHSSGSSSTSSSSSSSSGGSHQFVGPKFKLISEGDVQVCKVKHGQNLMSKLTSSKLLRRWETHHLYLNDSCISSKTPIGCLSNPIAYWQMEEVYVVVRWDSGRRYVIRIVLPDGSLLLQGSNAYVRDQWYHSIQWKKNIFKYHNLMRSSKRPEVILKELKSLVDFATITPLQDDCISHVPIEIVSNLLDSAGDLLGKTQAEEVLVALAPLLERSHPPPSLCRFFSRHCRTRPRCPLVNQLFTPVVRRALKHNVDFGKYPYMRRFIQDYIQALNCHNDGINVVRNFVKSMHGPASGCPHPRVMSNLVSVCLAAIFAIFERNNAKRASVLHSETIKEIPWDEQLLCYMAVFDSISEFEDWRPSLAQLLQPIPFPDDALTNPLFTRSLSSVIRRIGSDNRCDVHQMVMGIRDGKEGWFHLYSTSNLACSDDGELWGLMLGRLLSCCCRRKRFLVELGGKLVGSCLLLALREHAAAQEALCLLLEWKIIQSEDQRVQIATTLQSTPTGSAHYAALCSRQLHLRELQQKGGPRKLTLPSRATDADLAKLLSCGSFGNLECLSLAFTQVTSACAEQLIKLPSLRYLNLWSTQFGDAGLSLISEHLPNLQVLNLCETPVTDKGLLSLTSMTSLRKLNLNSTHLSAQTFASLKEKLPALKEVDVRYTDAW